MRILRFLVGLAAVGIALWIIVGEQMTGASANAVINGEVVTVRADVAGDLTLPLGELGMRVARGEVVASIDDALVDTTRFDDLRMELDLAEADLAHAKARLAHATEMREALLTRTGLRRAERLTELRARLDHARARLEILEADELARSDDEEGKVMASFDELTALMPLAPITPRAPELALELAREHVSLLELALRAAERDVFPGDGGTGAAGAGERAVQLDREVAVHEADLDRAEARLEALTTRLGRAHAEVTKASGGGITSPVNGIFWEVLQADGVTVQRGDPLLRLLDCDAVFVTLSVTERVYNRLTIGQSARFRMQDDTRVFDGTVARLAGSGAATIYRNLAVAPSQLHLERYDVLLRLPELNADPELGCAVGRTGRAFFEPRPLDWLRGLAG